MGKQVLIISTSPRKGGNSEILADEFAKGARESGHSAVKICLYDRNIQFCKGCLACQKSKKCVIQDDGNEIVEQILKADVLVYATPIYFYEMSGQMKTLLDRTNPVYAAKYKFQDVYLLAAAADTSEAAMEGAVKGLQGWMSCFAQSRLAGVVCGTGVNQMGEARFSLAALQAAYEMGKGV